MLPFSYKANTVYSYSIGKEKNVLQSPAFTKSTPQTYEQIGHRVQRILADPKRQKTQSVTVARLADELPADWRRLMTEIGETAGIRLDELDEDAVRITWKEYCEA